MPSKCQWCGADRCEVEPLTHIYLCGSSETLRHAECYEHEIKRLRKALEEIATPFNAICATQSELLAVACARQDIAREALDNGD